MNQCSVLYTLEVAPQGSHAENKVGALDILPHFLFGVGADIATTVKRVVLVKQRFAHWSRQRNTQNTLVQNARA
jgi:hypothetical protein